MVTAAEVEQAPEAVRKIYDELVDAGSEVLPVSGESMEVLAAYQRRAILGPKFRNDMLHIAVATVAEADVVVSWNFKHIVRLDRIRQFNSVNRAGGRDRGTGRRPAAASETRKVSGETLRRAQRRGRR